MATSARAASLQSQRQQLGYGFGDTRRILSPTSNNISTIARKNATNLMDIKITQYNDGLISNEEMRAFLEQQLNVPGIDAAQQEEIQSSIRDFDLRVRKDSLEQVFKNAPQNSVQQVQAAQALASFYQQRADSMQPGTPAQSQALENMGVWSQRVADIKDSVEKEARANIRYQTEQQIYQLPSGSSDEAYAKAQMYVGLRDQAIQDGDTTEANRYASLAQQFATDAQERYAIEQERSSKQAIADQKNTIRQMFGQLQDDYHDGRINKQQYLESLASMENFVYDSNDYGLINQFDKIVDKVYKSKEVTRGVTDQGLPVEKGPAGANSTEWDVADNNYKDQKRILTDGLSSGKLTVKAYVLGLQELLTERYTDIKGRIDKLEQMEVENPNAKMYYGGSKKRVEDILNNIYIEDESISSEVQAFENGNFILLEQTPDELTEKGEARKGGIGKTTYIIKDKSTLTPEELELIVPEDNGFLYHTIKKREVQYDDKNISQDGTTYTDPKTNQSYTLLTDENGNLYYTYARSFDPSANIYTEVPVEKGKPISSWQTRKEEFDKKAADAQLKAQTIPEPLKQANIFEATKQAARDVGKQITGATREVKENIPSIMQDVYKIAPMIRDLPTLPKQIEETGRQVVKAFPEQVQKPLSRAPIQAAIDVLPQKVQQPAQRAYNYIQQSPFQALSTAIQPKSNLPTVKPSKEVFSFSNKPNVTYTPIEQKPIDIKTPLQEGGLVIKQPVQKPSEKSLATQVSDALVQSPFNFLKKKLGF